MRRAPDSSPGLHRLQRAYYGIAIGVLIAVTLYWGKVVFVPLALAILLSFALTPAAEWLERRRLGRWPSVFIVSFAAFAAVAGVSFVAGNQVVRLAGEMPKNLDRIQHKLQPLFAFAERVEKIEEMARPDPAKNKKMQE